MSDVDDELYSFDLVLISGAGGTERERHVTEFDPRDVLDNDRSDVRIENIRRLSRNDLERRLKTSK